MKTIVSVISAFIIFLGSTGKKTFSQNATLTVKVNGIQTISGNIQIGLYNNSENFPDVGGEYKIYRFKVNAKSMQYSASLPAGTYSIALFHDENSDGECNTNFFGIPTEGYGFSNNVEPVISVPSFNETKFSFTQNTAISINLIY